MKGHKRGMDVSYHLPNKKKPIAYSTTATSNLIGALSTELETIKDVYDNIMYDKDAKEILEIYIAAGLGEKRASEYFR